MSQKASADYIPDEKEVFMNSRMRAYFKQKLLDWKNEILNDSDSIIHLLQENDVMMPDLVDQANSATLHSVELRTRDRQRKLIAKIDAALSRIENGSYGYCEETGEAIDVNRLIARPIATLSLEAQKKHEALEKGMHAK